MAASWQVIGGISRDGAIAMSGAMPPRMCEESVHRPGRDDAVGFDAGLDGPRSAVGEKIQLARRVRVGVDAEEAPGF